MNKILIKIIVVLLGLWSKVYTYRMSSWMKNMRNTVYTLWIRNFLRELGEGSIIEYPCLLQGGGQKFISIGDNTKIQGHSILGNWIKYGEQEFAPTIKIGNNCNIGEYTQITACNKITIGDGLLTGRFVYIGDNSHGGLSEEEGKIPPAMRCLFSKGEIRIGNNVWIGDKVTILGGVTIGDNVIIAANAVVVNNLFDNCIAAGVPARVVKSTITTKEE